MQKMKKYLEFFGFTLLFLSSFLYLTLDLSRLRVGALILTMFIGNFLALFGSKKFHFSKERKRANAFGVVTVVGLLASCLLLLSFGRSNSIREFVSYLSLVLTAIYALNHSLEKSDNRC